MIKNLILSLSTIFLFTSCEKETKRNIVEFNTGFNTSEIDRGVFFNKETNKHEIYFLKPLHNQTLKFFDESGVLLDSITLQVDPKKNINNLKVFSKDSILYTLGSENVVNLINRKGKIVATDYLKEKLNLKDNYFFFPFRTGSINYPNINDIIFSIYYQANDSIIEAYEGNFDFFYEYQNKSFQILNIKNLFTSKEELKLGLKDFFFNISKTPLHVTPLDYSTLSINTGHIFHTIHDNHIYILNKNLEIERKVKILEDEDKLSYIFNVMYNKSKNSYYFIIFQNEEGKNIHIPPSTLKIQEFDNEFKLIKSKEFDINIYDANNILLINDKIYIGLKENRIYGKMRYEIFDNL